MKTLLHNKKNSILVAAASSCLLIFASCQKEQLPVPIAPFVETAEPIASFEYSIEGPNAPVTVNFINTSANATSVVWDFGAGEIAVGNRVVREYETGGTYVVKLTAIGPGGTNTKVEQIKINDAAKKMIISSLTITKTKTSDPDHDTRGNGEADLYVKILDSWNTLQPLFISNVVSNVGVFPLSWSPNIDLDFTDNPGHKFTFQVWDDDITTSDDLIDELDLIPSDYMSSKSNYPQTITLTKENTSINLTVEWK